jgi:hypothetical protein
MVLESDIKNLVKCIPLSYYSYNKRILLVSVIIILCFITFISIATMAMRYELFNKQDFCDPTFYYGRACRNVIAKNMIEDPNFVKYKQKYYSNIDKSINPRISLDTSDIDNANVEVNANEVLTSDAFIDNSTKKIVNITDVLTQIKTQSLGSLGEKAAQPIKDLNNIISDKLKDLPNMLKQIQSQLNDGFIKPSTLHLYDALEKLYKSTLDRGIAPGSSISSGIQ